MARQSLRFRILILALGLEALTLFVFGAIVRHRSFSEMVKGMDEVLTFQTEALASLVFSESDAESIVDRMAAQQRFLGRTDPDIFQVTRRDRSVVVKSLGLGEERVTIPPEIRASLEPGEAKGFELDWHGEPYRARCLRILEPRGEAPLLAPDPKGAPGSERVELFVVYAESLDLLTRRQATLSKYMAMIGAVVLLVSAFALRALAWLGLLPLTRLTNEVASVEPARLDYRVDARQLPRDLDALARSVNGFLERIEKAFSREKQFAADAAHELCTPIAILKSNVQLALIDKKNRADTRETLQGLLADIERLERVADSLLALSEAEAGLGGRPGPREIDLQPLLAALAERFAPMAAECGVAIEVAPGNGASVLADGTAVDRILSNLIDNAIKYNRRGGTVWLSAGAAAEGVEVRVADDGAGIPQKDVPQLFERFFRVDKSRSRERGGAGLGLAIARSLCQSQRATIRFEPRTGGGSIFIVRFPKPEAGEGEYAD